MLKALLARAHQGHRTMAYPAGEPPPMPERFRGLPALDPSKCPDGCRSCADVCPTDAIPRDGPLALDLGRCLFCVECVTACPEGAIAFTHDARLATRRREDLVLERSGPAARGRARRKAPPAVRTLPEAARRERGRLQRLQLGRQRPRNGRLGRRPLRNPVRRVSAPRRRAPRHRARDREHAARARRRRTTRCRRRRS